MRSIPCVMLFGGCYAAEMGLSRQGLVDGTAASGGLGWAASASTYHEDGEQNVSGGMSFQYLQQSPEGEGGLTMGGDARYARQLGGARRWRGFGRVSAGMAPCDWKDCGEEREMEAASMRTLGAAIGVERFVWTPDPADPGNSGWFSTSLGIVYSRSTHETLGDGDFIGLELGMRVGINVLRSTRKP